MKRDEMKPGMLVTNDAIAPAFDRVLRCDDRGFTVIRLKRNRGRHATAKPTLIAWECAGIWREL